MIFKNKTKCKNIFKKKKKIKTLDNNFSFFKGPQIMSGFTLELAHNKGNIIGVSLGYMFLSPNIPIPIPTVPLTRVVSCVTFSFCFTLFYFFFFISFFNSERFLTKGVKPVRRPDPKIIKYLLFKISWEITFYEIRRRWEIKSEK